MGSRTKCWPCGCSFIKGELIRCLEGQRLFQALSEETARGKDRFMKAWGAYMAHYGGEQPDGKQVSVHR